MDNTMKDGSVVAHHSPAPEAPTEAPTEERKPLPPVAARSETKARGRALAGFILGALAWLVFIELFRGTVTFLGRDYEVPIAGLAGAAIAVSRYRKLLWGFAGAVTVATALLGYTPLVGALVRGWVRSDPLQQAPAVVVLAADNDEGQSISLQGQARILKGYEIVGQGLVREMVVSRGSGQLPSWIPAVRSQMERLGIRAPLQETAPVNNTHDEAVAVAKIVNERGWDRVILVTQPMHMRRAAATFEKAGVRVLCAPSDERNYNLGNLAHVRPRLSAFRDWLHEVIGVQLYRRRGWL